MNPASQTALRDDFQCLGTCGLNLIQVGDVDLEVIGSLGVWVGLDFGFACFNRQNVEDLAWSAKSQN